MITERKLGRKREENKSLEHYKKSDLDSNYIHRLSQTRL